MYASETDLLKGIHVILERFEKISEEDQEYLVQELRKTTEGEVAFHKTQVNRIRMESDRIKQKDDNLLEAFLDKSITKDTYDKKHQEYYDKLQLNIIELEEHQKGDFDYQTTVASVFSVARRAKAIFMGSEPNENRSDAWRLDGPAHKTKLSYQSRREMKRIAEASEPPVVIPIVVVAVHVDITVIVPAIERRELYRVPSVPLPLEYSQGCIVFGIVMP